MVHYLRWPVMFVLIALSLAILYWIGPSRRSPRFIWACRARWRRRGSGRSLRRLLLVRLAAGRLCRHLRVPGHGRRLHDLAVAVLDHHPHGGELNAELEHQTARDTTMWHPKPLGARGAVMADNVGPATIARDA